MALAPEQDMALAPEQDMALAPEQEMDLAPAFFTRSTSDGWGTYSRFIVFQIVSHVSATIRAKVACPN